MAEEGSLVIPKIDGDDRVNTGIANPIDVHCMYKPSQYLPLSGRFKPKCLESSFNLKERVAMDALSKEEKDGHTMAYAKINVSLSFEA